MRYLLFIFTLMALALICGTAKAQYLDIPGTPHTVIHDQVNSQDVPVFIGAFLTPFGPSLGLFEPGAPGQFKSFWASDLSLPWPQPPVAPAAANTFIASLLPQINGAIANRFSLPSGNPPPCGNLACDAVNQALHQSWSFKHLADGTTILSN